MAVSSYVTTQARLKLLGEPVLCCDTESAIFVQNVDEPPKVKTGDYLGHITGDLEKFGSGSFIDEFIRMAQRTMRLLFSVPRQEHIQPNAR